MAGEVLLALGQWSHDIVCLHFGRHCSTVLPNAVVEWLAVLCGMCGKSQHQISTRWPAVLLFFSYYLQIAGHSLKLGHGRFLPCPCAFVTAKLSYGSVACFHHIPYNYTYELEHFYYIRAFVW